MTAGANAAIDRLRARLGARAPLTLPLDPEAGQRAAAVLVPLVVREGGLALLLTERHADLPSHPGQVAFPGGKLDPGDADLFACALREAEEELGLGGAEVEILGRLDDVPTFRSGFVISPIVGLVRGDPQLRPNPREVATAFYAPLEALPEAFEDEGERHFGEITWRMIAYRLGRHVIWGATARMVMQLLELLAPEPAPLGT